MSVKLFTITQICLGLTMNILNSHEPSQNLSHEQRESSFEAAKQSIVDKIQSRGDLVYISVNKQLELLEQISQFDLGKFLIERNGLNGFWTHHIISHPLKRRLSGLNSNNLPFHPLEDFLLNRAPTCLATQQRFAIFKTLIQDRLQNGSSFASIPCGLMGDFLDLDFSNLDEFFLCGIDLDPEALAQATSYAEEKKLVKNCIFFQQNAWNLQSESTFDLIASNGLNIYEPDDEKVIELYRQFYKCLKPQGTLVTSFLTPPPISGMKSEWLFERVNPQDALLQKIIFADILSVKWQVFRSEEMVKEHLSQAGFSEIEIFYDDAHIFPSVVAKKK